MRKKLRLYRQTWDETCGPACILMLLDYYKIITYPTKRAEKEIYDAYETDVYPGMNGAAVARHLAQRGLKPTIYYSSENGMDNKERYFEEGIYQGLLLEYHTQIEKANGKVKTVHTQKIDCDFLREQLKQGCQIILECFVEGNADGIHEKVLHWVVVYGYQDGEFLVADPAAVRKRRIPDAEMEEYMETPIGRMAIAVKEPENSNI